MIRALRWLAFGAACALAARASGAEPQAAAAAPKPTVYALVSAVGDQFTYVRQRPSVGSNLPPYGRHVARIPGDALHAAVLRGLDRVVAEDDPGSVRVFVKLNSAELDDVPPMDRERVAIGKVVSALERLPQRSEWNRIIVVTPNYLYSGREGLAGKLQGIGVFIQPVQGAGIVGMPGLDPLIDSRLDPQAVTPDGESSNSRVFIAPYFYTKVWVLDARTFEVLETESRFDFQRIYDPAWTAMDVERNLSPEELAGRMEKFVERASAKALGETLGVVKVGDPRQVSPTGEAK